MVSGGFSTTPDFYEWSSLSVPTRRQHTQSKVCSTYKRLSDLSGILSDWSKYESIESLGVKTNIRFIIKMSPLFRQT